VTVREWEEVLISASGRYTNVIRIIPVTSTLVIVSFGACFTYEEYSRQMGLTHKPPSKNIPINRTLFLHDKCSFRMSRTGRESIAVSNNKSMIEIARKNVSKLYRA
jgi:hypothetical protein